MRKEGLLKDAKKSDRFPTWRLRWKIGTPCKMGNFYGRSCSDNS